MPSAFFTVNGSSQIIAHEAAYSSTVNLALTSLTGIQSIAWSIASTSKADLAAPVITPAGSPTGATASFTMPSDPGDDLGRAFIVQCTVSGGGQTATHRAVVGKANINDTVPICVDEALERNATHGWTEPVNEMLAATGGGGGPVTLPLDAEHGDELLQGEILAGGSFANLVVWGVDDTDILTLGDNTLVAGQQYRIASGGLFGFYVNDVNVANLNATQLELEGVNLRLSSGNVQVGSIVASAGSVRLTNTGSVAARNNANNADVDLLQKTSADLVIIGDSTDASGLEFKTKTATTFIFDIAGTDEYTMSATELALGSNNLTTTGNIQIGSTPSTAGDLRVTDGFTLAVRIGGNNRTIFEVNNGTLLGMAVGHTALNNLFLYASTNVQLVDSTGLAFGNFAKDTWQMRASNSTSKTFNIDSSSATGTGIPWTINGQDKSSSTSTNVGGDLTIRAGNATGAGATHGGGVLTLQGGDATGGSGTRAGGALVIRAGTGATSNGELSLQDGSTKRIRIDGTGLAFFSTAPIAKPTVSGAKGSNAALGSLITALSNLGLVTDSTSA